ncbi:hypothetical protein LCGC14_2169340 [marine sediment metagenome]|uniref:Uncharacterized protein n=1 Tax=marine sediment metagenome TaxID=412755 RepID=A0A0F9ECQ5_9ZZZZ
MSNIDVNEWFNSFVPGKDRPEIFVTPNMMPDEIFPNVINNFENKIIDSWNKIVEEEE